MGPYLLVLIALPLVDLYLLGRVSARVGTLPVLVLVALAAIVGFNLARAEGWRALRRWQETTLMGQSPGEGLLTSLLVFVSSVLLMLPGLLTDALGLLLLLPPIRRVIARLLRRWMEGAVRSGRVQVSVQTPDVVWPRDRRHREDVVDAEFEEKPPTHPPLPQ